MLFDATVSLDGKIREVRGNQQLLDKMSDDGYQIIDKRPIATPHPTLPKDVISNVQEVSKDHCSCCNGSCQC